MYSSVFIAVGEREHSLPCIIQGPAPCSVLGLLAPSFLVSLQGCLHPTKATHWLGPVLGHLLLSDTVEPWFPISTNHCWSFVCGECQSPLLFRPHVMNIHDPCFSCLFAWPCIRIHSFMWPCVSLVNSNLQIIPLYWHSTVVIMHVSCSKTCPY